MAIPAAVLFLAGFVLAHSAWSVSDLPKGELLCPLAIIEKDGRREIIRFESATQEKAIAEGKAKMATLQNQVDSWAFARELRMTQDNESWDVIAIDAWHKGMPKPINVIQRFRPFASGKFAVVGEPMIVVNGEILESQEISAEIKTLITGVRSHSKVTSLWDSWFSTK